MAKAILEYDLNEIDDIMAHKRAVKSLDMALAIWEIYYNLKREIEREIEDDKLLDLSQYDLVDRVFGKINDELQEHNINPDELIH